MKMILYISQEEKKSRNKFCQFSYISIQIRHQARSFQQQQQPQLHTNQEATNLNDIIHGDS